MKDKYSNPWRKIYMKEEVIVIFSFKENWVIMIILWRN